jgi:hypothetical protein
VVCGQAAILLLQELNHFLGVLMERAKSSVFDMIHEEGAIDSLTFEHRVNIALQLSLGLKVCLCYEFCVNP